jgi:hypothetical protein
VSCKDSVCDSIAPTGDGAAVGAGAAGAASAEGSAGAAATAGTGAALSSAVRFDCPPHDRSRRPPPRTRRTRERPALSASTGTTSVVASRFNASSAPWISTAFAESVASETGARLHAGDERAESPYRIAEHGQRRFGQRRKGSLQREQALLERARRQRDEREAARPMDAAKRVARPHHCRRGQLRRVELQQRQLVSEGRKMAFRFVDEHGEEIGRERDVADGDGL